MRGSTVFVVWQMSSSDAARPGVFRALRDVGDAFTGPATHVLLMAAAPADFRAAEVAEGKLTRDASLDLRLEPTEDILASLTATRTENQTIVAFAAEAGENVDRAREKLARKHTDLIVLNDISNSEIGFESQENAVTLIDSASETPVPQASKDQIADAILERVDQLRNKSAQPNR